MRHIDAATLITVLSATTAAAGVAQDQSAHPEADSLHQVTTVAPGDTSTDSLATVYVYRVDLGTPALRIFRHTMAVHLQREHERQRPPGPSIAGLQNRHYFVLRLTPGWYRLTFNLRPGERRVDLDAAAGEHYYVRLDRGRVCYESPNRPWWVPSSCDSVLPSAVAVPPQQWCAEVGRLRPIRDREVVDRDLVLVPTELTDVERCTRGPREMLMLGQAG